MGMPYSKQVHAAFDQVTPLVAAGFEVLKTTKNIAILLAIIQILVAIVLTLTLLAILALIYSVNPDLEAERQALVTPFMQWLASWLIQYGNVVSWFLKVLVVLCTGGLGAFIWYNSTPTFPVAEEPALEDGEKEDDHQLKDVEKFE
ncbi:hypothetical protein FPOAC2_11879 [Fusarium poae]|uniref:Uncharacterized protein n=1 Tax=Fusarium poae TaxID=36050 RepID=A0A1B8AEU9_FUSPO|nr:hypothetical protein FPOAC1_011570 [Fusarium poae]KAG8666753.1 hypothetical protein FPOAC1_011570 [Fusarium poae]OBS19003.1 hypothetical protein FPOA_10728 [Fusarium poae]